MCSSQNPNFICSLLNKEIKPKLFKVSTYSLLKPKKVCTHTHTEQFKANQELIHKCVESQLLCVEGKHIAPLRARCSGCVISVFMPTIYHQVWMKQCQVAAREAWRAQVQRAGNRECVLVIEQKNLFYHQPLPLEKMAPGVLNSMINEPPLVLYCLCKSQD